jgi:hypothetical protein
MSITMTVSSYVDRKGIAAAVSVAGVLVLSGIVAALFDAISADWQPYLVLANPVMVPEGISRWLLDVTISTGSQVEKAKLEGPWYLMPVALMTLVCGGLMYRRYSAEE